MENAGIISNNKRVFLFAIIGLLALLNIALFVWNRNMNYENTQLKANVDEIEETRVNLQTAYQTALTQLDEFEGENTRLDSLLTINKAELDVQQAEINALLSNKKMTSSELENAKTLISNLKLKTRTQVNTLDSLYNISQALAQTNLNLQQDLKTERTISDQLVDVTKILQTENDTLESQVEVLEYEKEEITAAAEILELEKQDLVADNIKLAEQVNQAAVLKTTNITAFGVRFKNNGKEKSTKDYRKVEKIKICYDVLENPIARSGIQELVIRVTHPEGFTLAVESTAASEFKSGSFMSAKDIELQYTTTADIDYKNDEVQSYCTYWAYDNELSPGVYRTEIYHLGHLIGQTTFELKNTIF